MKVAMVQLDLIWGDVQTNIENIKKILGTIEKNTDLIVLPETCTTGFHPSPDQISNLDEEYIINEFKQMSSEFGFALMGSSIMSVNGYHANRAFLVNVNEESQSIYQWYDKVHLFKMGKEDQAIKSGSNISTFKFMGRTIRPLICYDLRFPYSAFEGDLYDILVVVANWPVQRIKHWQNLLISRAIENQVFTIGVNRIGIDGENLSYSGNSMAIHFDGNSITQMKADEKVAYIQLDFEKQNAYRMKLPFKTDRRNGITH